ncbi:hypothetical protein V5O48_006182 [Marasmius crinis-equi]|uniref:C2H2-type domain-containing protein n=1 Tax=Marasmius crinis-equi TaxID=585013 RepID=A0ABR3FL34_9AGAR
MVSVRKLKQKEASHTNGFESGHEGDGEADIVGEEASSSKTPLKNGEESHSKRPFTRSQSGRPIKRRVRDDNALDPQSQSTSPAKRPKVARKRSVRKAQLKEDSKEVESEDADDLMYPGEESRIAEKSEEATQSPPPIEPSESSASTSEPSSAQDPLPMRYGTNRIMRATLPTPVPNLTKKSRGRRVPTKTGPEVSTAAAGEATDDKRSYVCSVEGCGKCFHRGEHLKRHIRSIHTHEKPFKCTFTNCEKYFNRHDNLLQHIKVHKQHVVAKGSGDEEGPDDGNRDSPRVASAAAAASNKLTPASNPLMSLAAAAVRPIRAAPTVTNLSDSGYTSGSVSTLANSSSLLFPSLKQTYTQMSFSSSIATTPYQSSVDSSAFSTTTNMAVSSLRSTEMTEGTPKRAEQQQKAQFPSLVRPVVAE